MATQRPVQTAKRGRVESSIWANQGKDGAFYRVTFQRTYRTTDGKLASSASFGVGELGDVALLAINAEEWIRNVEAGEGTMAGEGADDEAL